MADILGTLDREGEHIGDLIMPDEVRYIVMPDDLTEPVGVTFSTLDRAKLAGRIFALIPVELEPAEEDRVRRRRRA